MKRAEFEQGLLAAMPRLRHYAKKLRRGQDSAQDLLQSTLCHALEHWTQFEPGTNLFAWLGTVMYRLNINEFRRSATRPSEVNIEALPERPGTDDFKMTELVMDLKRGLGWLSRGQQQVVMLTIAGYSRNEQSEALGVAGPTIGSRLDRARDTLEAGMR